MTNTLQPAEVFPPGEYLRDELEARGWSVTEFAQIIGRPVQTMSEILNGRKEITAETATEIAAAFGTSPEVWLNLQNAYRLHNVRNRPGLSDVQRRAKLRSLVPLAELQKRGWIPTSKDLAVVERGVCDFLRIAHLDEKPGWTVAARRANSDAEGLMPAQNAWVARVAQLAADMKVGRFDRRRLKGLAGELPQLLARPEELGRVPGWLAEVGVALVVVEHLQASKIDGAAFRLDNRTPVIGLSLRGNRFDSVVFTLIHEIAHIVLGHADKNLVIDEDAASEHPTTDIETEANQQAGSWLFPNGVPISPPISQAKVFRVAETLGLHPSLVVGRLQWDGRLPWSSLRHVVPKVKDYLAYT